MDSVFYGPTTGWVLFVDLIIAIATIWLFKIGGASKVTQWIVGLGFFLFVALLHWVFAGQNIMPADLNGGLFYTIILGGASLGVLLFFATSKHYFDNLSQEHIQLAQGLRVFIGVGFLMEGVVNVIPGWFSIMDGYLHVASGFFALVAAVAYLKKHEWNIGLLWLANVVGLLDIVIIVTSICFLVWSDLGPFHNMNYVVFGAGPVLLWFHFMSIRKLVQTTKIVS